ncbi:hypothetical protein BOX15_Mlig015246g1, partial [Macrostomum lignano]
IVLEAEAGTTNSATMSDPEQLLDSIEAACRSRRVGLATSLNSFRQQLEQRQAAQLNAACGCFPDNNASNSGDGNVEKFDDGTENAEAVRQQIDELQRLKSALEAQMAVVKL